MTSLPPHSATEKRSHWLLAGIMAIGTALVSACKSAPEPAPASAPDSAPSAAPGADGVRGPVPASAGSARPSVAATARAYRQDAASHLYGLNRERIFRGKLPPQLYAIGVLQVDIDRSGKIARLHWMRAPRHAPEVVAEIERTVRAAAPFPAPTRMGKVTYTDTWLWDKSGHFQLDTLTEGQH